MVERKESQGGLDEFDGKVVEVKEEIGMNENTQFHIEIEPTSIKVGGKTGRVHEWVPLSKTSNDSAVAKGSVMDAFLKHLEIALPAAKKAPTVTEALNLMVGKTFHFQKIELGRAYGGKDAKQYSVPVRAV